MAYRRGRASTSRRSNTKRTSSYSGRRAASRRSGRSRSAGSTVRIVIENPGMSQVARPFQTAAAPAKQAKF